MMSSDATAISTDIPEIRVWNRAAQPDWPALKDCDTGISLIMPDFIWRLFIPVLRIGLATEFIIFRHQNRIRCSILLVATTLALIAFTAVSAWGADAKRGAELYQQCKRCHQAGQGAEHRIGPHLNGIFGRRAGSAKDFLYSRAIKDAGSNGLIWTEQTLDAFLASPATTVPRSRMSFDGMQAADDRSDLLSWLRTFSGSLADVPAAQPTTTPAQYGLDPKILLVQGDPQYGAYLASECTTCHRSDGVDAGIPSITSWPVDDFVITLQAYKNGKRVHPTMQMIATRLSDEEIASLATYFRNLNNQP